MNLATVKLELVRALLISILLSTASVPFAQPGYSNSGQSVPLAISTFDNDDEGWKLIGATQNGSIPTYFSTGGVPSGYISATDGGPFPLWQWVAPAKFLGDLSSAFAQFLTFDLRQSITDNQCDCDHVILSGQGLRLSFKASYNPGRNWTAYAIPLIENAGWTNQVSGTPATVTELLTVLSSLDSLIITGEYRNGDDTGGLDNVVLGAVLTSGPGASTFENDLEGWQIIGDAQGGSGVPDYWPTGGVPNGYISATDDGLGTGWFWLAPSQFLGDVSSTYSRFLTFDLRQSTTSNQFSFNRDVRLASGSDTLVFTMPYNPGINWTAYAVPIIETGGWWDQATGLAPTQVEMLAMLSNLTGLIIRGEFSSDLDVGSIDNVVLGFTPSSSCNYSLSSGNSSFPSTGGTGSFNIVTQDTCSWIVTNKVDWVTIISGSSGTGNGTVNFSVAANNHVGFRRATIAVEDRSFVVAQAGAPGKFNVYVLSGGNSSADQAVMAALAENDISATLGVQPHQWDGSQAELDSFEAVVMLNSYNSGLGDMPQSGQTELTGFVTNGGGLVTGEWVLWNIGSEGRFTTVDEIIPAEYSAFNAANNTTYSQVTPDPILNRNLPPAFTFPLVRIGSGSESLLDPKTEATVYYGSSNTRKSGLIGWQKDAGRVLSFSTVISHVEMADSNYRQLFINAVEWVSSSTTARTVRLKETSGSPGGTVQVPVCLTAQGDENAVGFSVEFDAAVLKNPQAAKGIDASSAFVVTNGSLVNEGKFGVNLALPAGTAFQSGEREILLLQFEIDSSAAVDSTMLHFIDQPLAREVVDTLANVLAADWIDGVVRIARGCEGDVAPRFEGNGSLTLADWVQVGRFVAKLDTPLVVPNEFQRADCAPRETCGDGKLTLADWVQAGRYAAKLDPKKPAGGPIAPLMTSLSLARQEMIAENASTNNEETVVFMDAEHHTFIDSVLTQVLDDGDTTTIAIKMAARGLENALSFSLDFDTGLLKYLGFSLGANAGTATVVPNESMKEQGSIGFLIALPFGQTFPADTVETLVLRFLSAEVESPTKVNVSFSDAPITREVVDALANVIAARFEQSDFIVKVEEREYQAGALPASFTLSQSYPNPFGGAGSIAVHETTIRYALPRMAEVVLAIYNLQGQLVKTLAAGSQMAGIYTVTWDGKDAANRRAANGVYLYSLRAGEVVLQRKLVLVR